MVICIQIPGASISDIYTVSYTPTVGDTIKLPLDMITSPATTVDLTGTTSAWVGPSNLIYFKNSVRGTPIAKSLLNVAIVMRRNSSNVRLTPVVDDYLLSSGSKNENKFG